MDYYRSYSACFDILANPKTTLESAVSEIANIAKSHLNNRAIAAVRSSSKDSDTLLGLFVLGLGALAVGAYGGWGIADRELNALWSRPGAPAGPVLALRFARGLAASVATLATVALLGSVFIPLLGLWRS